MDLVDYAVITGLSYAFLRYRHGSVDLQQFLMYEALSIGSFELSKKALGL